MLLDAPPPDTGLRARLGSLLFGFEARVDRRTYRIALACLFGARYALEALATWWVCDEILSPLVFATGCATLRPDGPGWLFGALWIASLPFTWVTASLTVRRALDAGCSGWTALWVFAPLLNYLAMVRFCRLPSHGPHRDRPVGSPYRTRAFAAPAAPPIVRLDPMLECALAGLAYGFRVVAALAVLALAWPGLCAVMLLLGLPLLVGVESGFLFNESRARSLPDTLLAAFLGVALCAGGLVLFFSAEVMLGLICVLPFFVVPASCGASIGRFAAGLCRPRGMRVDEEAGVEDASPGR